MEKNWLIRTKSNHILGPVSKDKVLELYANNSIKADDEICSGNGFWFFIREDDMVDLYLKGNKAQGFNPISEAKDILTHSESSNTGHDRSQDDITLIGNVNMSGLKKSSPAKLSAVPEETERHSPEPAYQTTKSATPNKKKTKLEAVEKEPSAPREKKVHKNQNFLQYLIIAAFILLFCLVYFRKYLVKAISSTSGSVMSVVISDAHAQDSQVDTKKKNY